MKLPRIRRNASYYLRVFRAERDLSQADAAQLFGISPSHWSLMEEGKRHASPKVASALAKATRAPVELFIGIEVSR